MGIICRLCLNPTNDFDDLRKIDTVQFQTVLPEVDLDLLEQAFACRSCVNALYNAYIFKRNCMKTEASLKLKTLNVLNTEISEDITQTIPSIKPFGCKLCKNSYSRKTQLFEHIKSHFEFLKCSLCANEYHDYDSIQHHIKTAHDGADTKNIIDKILYGDHLEDSLWLHMEFYRDFIQDSQTNDSQNKKCSWCEKYFKRDYVLLCHEFKNHWRLCRMCKMQFFDRNSYETHMRTNHSNLKNLANKPEQDESVITNTIVIEPENVNQDAMYCRVVQICTRVRQCERNSKHEISKIWGEYEL